MDNIDSVGIKVEQTEGLQQTKNSNEKLLAKNMTKKYPAYMLAWPLMAPNVTKRSNKM